MNTETFSWNGLIVFFYSIHSFGFHSHSKWLLKWIRAVHLQLKKKKKWWYFKMKITSHSFQSLWKQNGWCGPFHSFLMPCKRANNYIFNSKTLLKRLCAWNTFVRIQKCARETAKEKLFPFMANGGVTSFCLFIS